MSLVIFFFSTVGGRLCKAQAQRLYRPPYFSDPLLTLLAIARYAAKEFIYQSGILTNAAELGSSTQITSLLHLRCSNKYLNVEVCVYKDVFWL